MISTLVDLEAAQVTKAKVKKITAPLIDMTMDAQHANMKNSVIATFSTTKVQYRRCGNDDEENRNQDNTSPTTKCAVWNCAPHNECQVDCCPDVWCSSGI